jgi:hypothetical protein
VTRCWPRTLSYLRPHWGILPAALAQMLVISLCELLEPWPLAMQRAMA